MNAFRRTWNVRGDSIPEELRFQHTSHPVAYAYINVRDWYEVAQGDLRAYSPFLCP